MVNWQQSPLGSGWYRFAGLVTAIAILLAWPACTCAEPGQLRAVVLKHQPPQYQLDGRGQPTGFAIDILEQVAAAADIKVTYKVVDSWEEAFAALETGQADLIPNIGINPERPKWLTFTSAVETFPIVIAVRRSTAGIKSQDDLSGRVVATIQFDDGTRLMSRRSDIKQRVFPNVQEALFELLAGHVDALVYPQPVLMKLAVEAGIEDLVKVAGPPLLEIKHVMAIGKDNNALLQRLEPAVQTFVTTQKYKPIYAKWYGRPKPFWSLKRMVLTMSGLILIITLLYTFQAVRSNQQLKQSLADQEKAQSALQASEEKYRRIVNSQSDLTIKLDARGRMLFANPRFYEIFDFSEEDIKGRRFLDLVHQKDREKVRLALQGLQAAPHSGCHEERLLTPMGWRWFSWSNKALVDKAGQVTEIIAVGRDITERRETELELKESVEKFRAIFEQAADGVVLLNKQTLDVAEFNTAAHHTLGYSKEGFARLNLKDLVVPEPPDTSPAVIERVVNSSQHPIEVMLRSQSGQVRHFLITQRPLAINGIEYLLGIWHDITERKALEAHLIQSQKMEAIGSLAGGVAHDFNNILSIIIGNAELALLDTSESHPAQNRLREIHVAGERAKAVVRQLLRFSRQEPENRTLVLLAPLIGEIMQLLRATLPTTIDIRSHVLATDVTLVANATQIHQVLMNLCTNAAQAMTGKGGVIGITLSSIALDGATAHHYGIKAGAYAQIRVEDTGCGIAPDIIERIFDPYFTTKKATQGTGIGLSIVHGIVARHNGAIDVESVPDRGTVFKVWLPLSKQTPPIIIDCVETISTGNESILLVDDQPAIVALGREMLEKLGYGVQAFCSAPEALAMFKADPACVDLIITDLTMPAMTGERLAKEIFKLRPDIPVILCSGYNSKVDEKRLRDFGIKIFLPKPYTMNTLANVVRQALTEKIASPVCC
jgi:PAS domain S-box-containing protein